MRRRCPTNAIAWAVVCFKRRLSKARLHCEVSLEKLLPFDRFLLSEDKEPSEFFGASNFWEWLEKNHDVLAEVLSKMELAALLATRGAESVREAASSIGQYPVNYRNLIYRAGRKIREIILREFVPFNPS
jgi:hypothetical protein